jgi:hypothetical protein
MLDADSITPPRHAAVCILGMHRSGTSCLAGALQAGGLCLGDVVTSAPHNRKGNREHLEIRALNDRVMAFSGGTWSNPPAALHWNAEHAAERDGLIARLGDGGTRIWGFKDPRTVLTLEFWRAGAPLRFVGTFRHPLAVAASLTARDGLPPDVALDLWRHYNGIVVEQWRHHPFPLIRFDSPPDAYRNRLADLLAFIGLDRAGTDFFAPDLVHQDGPNDANLPSDVRLVWEELLECSRDAPA